MVVSKTFPEKIFLRDNFSHVILKVMSEKKNEEFSAKVVHTNSDKKKKTARTFGHERSHVLLLEIFCLFDSFNR